jgi:tetratricopeptide (TPR) repeat protein
MSTSSRTAIEVDLARHRQSGDFAAQAATLFALGEMAKREEEYNLAHGLYGQAWAAYEKAGNTYGQARAVREIAESMSREFWNHEDDMPLEFDLMHIRQMRELAQTLYVEVGDLRGQAEIYVIIGHEARDRDNELNAFQQALKCYETLGDVERQAHTLISLSRTCEPKYPLLEQALILYQQIGDKRGEANILFRIGDLTLREKKLAQALSLFEISFSLFIASNSFSAFSVADTLGSLILETKGYAAYHTYTMSTAYRICLVSGEEDDDKDDSMFSFWKDLAKTARKHQDFETASYAYQQAALYTVGIGFSERRADLYWRWGHLDYHALKHRERGFMMCERAVTLMHDPDELTRYQRKLEHMRGEMKAYRKKKSHK